MTMGVQSGKSGGACRARVNVGNAERVVSALAGVALAIGGYKKGGWMGVGLGVTGAALAARGATGHCFAYKGLNISTAKAKAGPTPTDFYKHGVRVEESVTIQQPAATVFAFWRDFENLGKFLGHVKSVQVISDTRSKWVAEGPMGKDVSWEAEIINEEPGKLIAWQSLPGAVVAHTGSVRFREAAAGRGTEVHVVFEYLPPAGRVGLAIAKALGTTPGSEVRDDLRRLRMLLETGEVPTTRGQASGRRSVRVRSDVVTAAVAGASRVLANTDHPARGGKFGRGGHEEEPDAEAVGERSGVSPRSHDFGYPQTPPRPSPQRGGGS